MDPKAKTTKTSTNTNPTANATGTQKAPALKKGPSPVFSIPATKEDKTYIGLQSTRTGKSQKDLLAMSIASARKAIEALPNYVAPEPVVKVKAKKAAEAAATLAQTAPATP